MKILFYKGRARLFNRGVSWLTVGPYSHCEVVTAEHLDGSITCWGASFTDGGVREKRMTLHPDNWDVVDVPSLDADKAVAWLEANRGMPYDKLGLMGFFFRPITGNHDKVFCSELIAILLCLKDPWRYDPNTLYSAIGGKP